MTPIDLRSDTVTRPSAALLGAEAALFSPSGTQANQTGIMLSTYPGTELLLEADAHLVHSEQDTDTSDAVVARLAEAGVLVVAATSMNS